MNAVKSKRLSHIFVNSLFSFSAGFLPEIEMDGQGEEENSHQDTGQDGQFKIEVGKSPAGDIDPEITKIGSDKGYISGQVLPVDGCTII